jgi:acyl-CoA thioester hydrolase
MRKHGELSATVECEVSFHDVDMVEIVWHGHYLRYLENARWALMKEIDFGLEAMRASGYGWPIVDLHVKYIRAARFGDRLSVRASLAEWENRLTVNYLVTDLASRERVVRAQTQQVAVELPSGVLQFVSPAVLIEKVTAALAGRFKAFGANE